MANIFTPDWIPESYRENFIDQANLILSEFPTITPEALNSHWERFSISPKWIDDHDKVLRQGMAKIANRSELKALFEGGKDIELKATLTAGATNIQIIDKRIKKLIIDLIQKDVINRVNIGYVSIPEPPTKKPKGKPITTTKHLILFYTFCHHAIFAYHYFPRSKPTQKKYLIGLLATMNGFNKPLKTFEQKDKQSDYQETLLANIKSFKRDLRKYMPDITEALRPQLPYFNLLYPGMEPEKHLQSFWRVKL